ncbi:MAG: relaxase domain-containing protein [Planctomycetia bacterium]|nr:relaxase domain-containing protein [Planctomycetia bacterium]
MNTIKSLKGQSASGIVDYYENNHEKKGEKGYYSENGKAPSQWHGKGAEMLGLSGAVDAKTLKNLLEKGPPGMETVKNRRMGAEIHWAPPKSVSMLIEAAPPEMREKLLDLCRQANAINMQHIEENAVCARYGKGGQVSEKTGNIIIATFQHEDARPVVQEDGSLKVDMQHHFHNLLVNATHDENGWRGMDLDMGAMAVEQQIGDFKAKAFLASEFEKMGIATRKTKDGFEVAAISREQIESCSGRGMQIEAELAKQGKTRETSTGSERNAINQSTKQNKIRDLSKADLMYRWREDLRAAGLEFSAIYDPKRDTREISKSGQESTEVQKYFNTEQQNLPSSTSTTEKEQEHGNKRFIQHTEELHPEQIEPLSGYGMRTLSGRSLDATERGEGAGLLQDHARPGGSENHDLRREPASAGAGGLTEETEAKARQAIDAALDHLSEKDSLFDKRQLALEAIKNGMGEVSGSDIEAAMKTHERIVWAGEQTKEIEQKKTGKDGESYVKKIQIKAEMVTTTETVAREGWLQGFCQEGRSKLSPLMNANDAQKAVEKAQKAQGFLFADDQKAAVIATLTTQDRVSAMIGGAGTGKTTAMKSMVDAARGMGYETVGLTPSHGARQELLDAKTDKNVTAASFLMQKAKDGQKPRLYILDEAGMVGDRTMQAVLQKMGPKDRILLSGDPDQMKPVEAGDPMQTLVDKGIIHVARLTQVQRQAKAEDKDLLALGQAWADRDTGKALELVKKYIQEVRVEGTGKADKDGNPKITKEDRRAAIATGTVNEYMGRSEKDRTRTMIICPTNDVRGLINHGIREQLQASGALPGDSVSITQLTKTAMSAEHMTQAHQYEPGQIMRTKEGQGKEQKSVDYEVVKADGQHNRLTLKGPDGIEKTIDAGKISSQKWQVFNQVQGMGLAVGEKLVIRDNSVNGAQNGDGGQITGIENGKVTLQMDRGQTVVLDSKQALAVDYGYARTVNDSQGKSVDLPIMTGEASAGSSRNLLLVGTTRMRHGLTVITDHAAGLIKRSQDYADKNVADQARKNADLKTDRRLDRLDSILENGKEHGAQDVEKQLNPDPQKQAKAAEMRGQEDAAALSAARIEADPSGDPAKAAAARGAGLDAGEAARRLDRPDNPVPATPTHADKDAPVEKRGEEQQQEQQAERVREIERER